MKRVFKFLLALCIPLSFGAAAADRVQVSYQSVVHGLPLYIALEEKLFEKAGLDVTATPYENPNQIIDSWVSGRADAGMGATGVIVLAETRFPGIVKLFGLNGSNEAIESRNDALVVKADAPYNSVADLRGKKIARPPGGQWRTLSRAIIKGQGLDPDKDVEFVDMAIGLHTQAVAAGTVSAALTLEPNASIASGRGVVRVLMWNPSGKTVANPFYASAPAVTTKFLNERPEVAKRYMEVLDRAAEIARDDFNNKKQYLIKYTPVTKETLEFVVPVFIRTHKELDDSDIVAYQKFADAFYDDGTIDKRFDVNNLLLRVK